MAINLFPLIAAFLISQFPVWEGVVIKSVKLKDNKQFLPGDRVLVIKKEMEKLPIFAPDGKFYQIDSSVIFSINPWKVPFSRNNFPKIEMKAYKEPMLNLKWKKQQMEKHYYFNSVAVFNEAEKLFWVTSDVYNRVPNDTIMRWFPYAIDEIKKFISDFPLKNDSLRAKYLFGLGDLMIGTPTKSLNFYRLAYEWSKKADFKDYAANSLLMRAWVYLNLKAQKIACEILDSVINNYAGVKCMVGRADAYAAYKLLENAKQNNDTTKVCSLAKYIIINFQNEDGAERVTGSGEWGSVYFQNSSLWFDIAATNILMDIIKEDDEKLVENANLLLASTNTAVKFIGYEYLIPFYYRKYEKDKALFYAKGAIVLPHYRKWETKAQFGDCIMPEDWVDFKVRFMDKLELLLPLSYLIQLYDFAYNLKDTSVAKDAARWFINKIEQGKLPPRPDLTEKITSDDDKEWFKRAFLSSIDNGYTFTITSSCTLYNKQKNPYYWKEPAFSQKKLLNKGDKISLFFLEDNSVRVKVNEVDFGWIKARQLKGNYYLKDIPLASIPKPVLSNDFTQDGVKDLGLEDWTIIGG